MPDTPNPTDGSIYDGREFHNLDGVPAGRSFLEFLRWKLLGRRPNPWPDRPRGHTFAPALPTTLAGGEMAATLVGHSTFLLQFAGGVNVLTDPIWSERASPVSFSGPRRARPPAISFEELPSVGLVLISHGHYDHMDLPTLRRLEERFSPVFVTGLRQGGLLRRQGLRRVEELDWWQSWSGGDAGTAGLKITFTPAQHWNLRTPPLRNRALWGGFWLQQKGMSAFFSGDTGFGRHFSLVRERLGRPRVAFLPIGAYEPRWFMGIQHMNPDDAVRAHLALGARRSLAMHFGTFQLTEEAFDAPAHELAAALRTHSVDPECFQVPGFGQTKRFGENADP